MRSEGQGNSREGESRGNNPASVSTHFQADKQRRLGSHPLVRSHQGQGYGENNSPSQRRDFPVYLITQLERQK